MANKVSKYQVESNIDVGVEESIKANRPPGIMIPTHPRWNNSSKIAHPNIKRIQQDNAHNQKAKKNTTGGNKVDERIPWNYSTRVKEHKSDVAINPIPGKKLDYSHVDKIVDDVMPDNILNQIHLICPLKFKTIPEKDLSQTNSVVDDWMPDKIFHQIRAINSLKVKRYPKEDLSNIDPVIDDRMSYEQLAKIRPIRLAKKNAAKVKNGSKIKT